jgi:nitroreductase
MTPTELPAQSVADRAPVSHFDALLRSRRTIHDFTAEPVDLALVEAAIASAHQAPNHKLTWPWRFTIVGRESRRALLPLALELKAKKRSSGTLPPPLIAAIESGLMDPAWLVVVRQVRCEDPERSHEDYGAVACAVQNLMLSLHAAGVGTKWSTGGLSQHPDALAHLGVDLATESCAGFVMVGHPAKVPAMPRPALDGVFVTRLP